MPYYFCGMEKILKQILLVFLCIFLPVCFFAQSCPFEDTSLDVSSRVEDLLGRLSLDEKLSLMEHQNPGIPRLGLKPYSWWNEALHGVGRNGLATVWPMPIALAATFDAGLVGKVFENTAYEARLKYYLAQQNENFGDYAGLTFFTPNINIFRDPRWGRGMETYGEDPFLTAIMGLACINGLQHGYESDTMHLTAAACLKHLAVHSGPEGIRHQFDATVSRSDLFTTYLPAFEYLIANSDVCQVMCAYNRVNGEPCCTNKELIVDILRNKWHYDGLLVTDCWALNDCWERDSVIPRHETHATAALAAADAFGSEVDLECGSGLPALKAAVDSGYITETKIDQHVRRILTTRMRVLENGSGKMKFNDEVKPANVASESFVLLKNESVLPLENKRIFVAGPNASDSLMPLGNYNGTPEHVVTIAEGLKNKFSIVDSVDNADVVVYVGGLTPQLEGEELPVDIPGFYKGDRYVIELPESQVWELKYLHEKNKPVILILCSGGAIALENVLDFADAVMLCWYGGEGIGDAVASVLAGDIDSFGRLPVTFYRNTGQLPDFASYDMAGRTYRYLDEKPLFPFGYGLSYSSFNLKDVDFDKEKFIVDGSVICDSSWSNATSSKAVVEVYLKRADAGFYPRKSLVGLKPVAVSKGESESFQIELDKFWFRCFDENLQDMEAPAAGTEFILQVGFSSDDNDLIDITFTY